MSSLRVGFIVQGEGRGHMTQALALAQALTDAGHRVEWVLVGSSPHRSLPLYFVEGFDCEVEAFEAPTQVPDADLDGVSRRRTAIDAGRRFLPFWRSGFRIAEMAGRVDVVVNFLDLIGGLSRAMLGWRTPTVAVAHNFLFRLPELADAPGSATGRKWLDIYERATSVGAHTRVALSFDPLDGRFVGLTVAPPLIGRDVASVAPRDEGFLLCYALNAGSVRRVMEWQRSRPETTVHCFVDGVPEGECPGAPGCHFHELDRVSFLDHLARCRAYVGTAGFESICEAHYLGKPCMAVPTPGQLEQRLNAFDAERCGVATAGSFDDLEDFWADSEQPDAGRVHDFRSWVDSGPAAVAEIVERAARNPRP